MKQRSYEWGGKREGEWDRDRDYCVKGNFEMGRKRTEMKWEREREIRVLFHIDDDCNFGVIDVCVNWYDDENYF